MPDRAAGCDSQAGIAAKSAKQQASGFLDVGKSNRRLPGSGVAPRG
jgi:hypothetical protein